MTRKFHQIVLGILIFFLASALAVADFTDVPADHESFEAISYLQAQGIMEGYPDHTFGPDLPINRAEFTKVIIKTLFSDDAISACRRAPFSDIAPDAWFLQIVCKAEQENIITGYPDGTFGGDRQISFSEAAAILVRGLSAHMVTDGNPWYRSYIEYLGSRNAIPLNITSLAQSLTRAQMAEMIYRLKMGVTQKPSRTYEYFAVDPAIHFEKREVQTSHGTFQVDVLTGDLSRGIKVVTDSAAPATCLKDCPALTLEEYVKRNGASAGIHGSYFCPPDYLSCADKINSFIYFMYAASSRTFLNSENRNWDTAGGFFVFRLGFAEFLLSPSLYGMDTDITGAFSMWPALVANGKPLPDHPLMDEKMKTVHGPKGGLGLKGSVVYLLLAHDVTVPDLRDVMVAMSLESGINLDGGGTSALYAEGEYKDGPGRKLPNAILLVE